MRSSANPLLFTPCQTQTQRSNSLCSRTSSITHEDDANDHNIAKEVRHLHHSKNDDTTYNSNCDDALSPPNRRDYEWETSSQKELSDSWEELSHPKSYKSYVDNSCDLLLATSSRAIISSQGANHRRANDIPRSFNILRKREKNCICVDDCDKVGLVYLYITTYSTYYL
jgi:hypothetical protein